MAAKNSKLLLCSLLITVSLMLVEVIGGIVSGSLTLLADAGHMFADVFALFLSWIPAYAGMTFTLNDIRTLYFTSPAKQSRIAFEKI